MESMQCELRYSCIFLINFLALFSKKTICEMHTDEKDQQAALKSQNLVNRFSPADFVPPRLPLSAPRPLQRIKTWLFQKT